LDQVPNPQQRVPPDHAGTGEAHDFSDPPAVNGIIAVNGAAAAGGFIITEWTFLQALVGVIREILTIRTQI